MAVAGNTTGAGGAKNLARVAKKRRVAKLAEALPSTPVKLAPARVTLHHPSAPPQAKRAQRVALSAQRKRTGTDRPIVVKRREKVSTQRRGLHALEDFGVSSDVLAASQDKRLKTLERSAKETGALAKGPVTPKKKKQGKGGVLGTTTAAVRLGLGGAKLADKVLSGKTTAGAVTAAANVAGKIVSGDYTDKIADPISAAILGHQPKAPGGVAKGAKRLARGAGHDIVDLPANVIPSLYVPGKQVATGHPEEAAKGLYKGVKETVTHPLDHPIGALLTVSGAGSVVGRGAGFAARTGALGDAARGAAKTARESKSIPGTRAERRQPYSPDVIRKGVQVLGERRAARRAAKKGQPARHMSTKDVHTEVDDFVRTSRNVRGRAEERVTHEVADALRHGKRRVRKATTHHTVAVRGLANATKADLQQLLAETERAGKGLTGRAKRQNARTVEHLRKAISEHTPEREAHIRETQKRYRDIDRRQEGEMVDLDILDQRKADEARYTEPAVRHGLHDPETAPVHEAMAGARRAEATKGASDAWHKLDQRREDLKDARTAARFSVAKRKRSPTLKRLEADRRRAATDLARATRDHQVARAERSIGAVRERGQVGVSREREVGQARAGLVEARRRLKAELAKPVGKRRGVAVLQGRVRDARQALNTAKVPVRERVGAPAEPAATFVQGIRDARDRVRAADEAVAAERARIKGVAPKEADALRRAIAAHEEARAERSGAIATRDAAKVHHQTLRAAPFIDREGRPSFVEDVAAHPALSGQPEPSFLPGAYESRVGALPEKRINIANPQGRSGRLVAEGRIPVSGGHLLNARVERERLIEAAKTRNDFIDHFGFREGGNHEADLARAGNEEGALELAGEAEKTTGTPMAPIHNQDGSWSVVPHDALDRLRAHEQAPTWADPIQRLGRQWRQGVLAFSAKWLTGQVGEGALRTAVHQGFNPVRLARSHMIVARTLDELRRLDPQAAQRFETLYKRGGAGRTAAQSRQEAFHDFQMGESSGKLMSALHDLERKPIPRAAGNVYGAWQKLMFEWLNGGVETAVRRGMVGRELLADPIFRDKGIVVNFSKAAKELAEGQRNTAAQNRLARQVDDAFGKYQGRGPAARHVIENVTPFIPWFLSAMRFLGVVLPRDHPVLSSLIVASNQSSKEWRKKYGLTTDVMTPPQGNDKSLPLYQQGSVPAWGGMRNVSHFTPMGAVQSLGDLGSFLMPQYNDIRAASKGEDWRGQPLTGRDTPPTLLRILEALGSAGLTTAAPPLGTAARVAGVHLPNVPDVAPDDEKTTLGGRVLKYINPLPAQKSFPGSNAKSGGGLKIKDEPLRFKDDTLKFKDEPLRFK